MAASIASRIQKKFPNLNLKLPLHDQLTSIEIVELLSFIESEFDIEIASIEYSPKHLESFTALESFIQSKIKRK